MQWDGSKFRFKRQEQGKTIAEIGQAANLSSDVIRRVELGDPRVRPITLVKYATALGMDPSPYASLPDRKRMSRHDRKPAASPTPSNWRTFLADQVTIFAQQTGEPKHVIAGRMVDAFAASLKAKVDSPTVVTLDGPSLSSVRSESGRAGGTSPVSTQPGKPQRSKGKN